MTASPKDARRSAPAAARNREPILEVLRSLLPERGLVLEIASGTGEHAAFIAPRLPNIVWQPSDAEPDMRHSIAAWAAEVDAPNLRPPLTIDCTVDNWGISRADAVFCANMIHIAPWEATIGLVRGAAKMLPPAGMLILYGPFKRGGAHTAPSNEAFDESLRRRDPSWGVRDLDDLIALAEEHGLRFDTAIDMPANNLTVVFRRF
jgi:SAM-dependent methyltransferase